MVNPIVELTNYVVKPHEKEKFIEYVLGIQKRDFDAGIVRKSKLNKVKNSN